MTNVTVADYLGDIEKYKFNPQMIQRTSMAALRAARDGLIEIVDPTNPLVMAIEATACNTAGFMQAAEAMTRRQYAQVAVTPEDLYLHMSDKDYIGRFALPSLAQWTFMISKEELLRALVEDPATGISQITIPRNTTFTVAGRTFSLQYPIDIRRLQHGALQVVWDVTKLSPLQTLETNLIDISEVTDNNNITYVTFSVPAYQFNIIQKFNDVNAASGFTTKIGFQDQFYFARVFYQREDRQWVEMLTTHTAQVYDPLTPTAVLKLLDQQLEVTIPIIYTTTNQVRNKIRIDLYQTAGDVDMLLGNYDPVDFVTKWLYLDANDASPYISPIANIPTLLVFSQSATAGGRNALPMEELRQRVITNSVGPQDLPITNVQLQANLQDDGYEIVKNVDTITNRIFLATKPMPAPVDDSLITAAASGISTVLLSFQEALGAYGVVPHYRDSQLVAMTITPSALYRTLNGVTKLSTVSAYQAIQSMPASLKVAAVNDGSYSYSPFHYVMDASGDNFAVRPYYMDGPKVLSKSFIAENATTGLQVSVDAAYELVRTDAGYRLTLATKSNAAYKNLDDSVVFCQLSFKAGTQVLPSFLLGVQRPRATQDDERIYDFDMPTDFDLDVNNTLDMPAFEIAATPITTRCDLIQDINVLFASSAPPGVGLEYTAIDIALGRFQLPATAAGITWERMKVQFGSPLDTLWAQARSVIGSVPYKTYPADVPRVYGFDIFDTDPATGASFTIVGGVLTYVYKHRAGDPVLDPNGDPVMEHFAGDPVLNAQGQPEPADGYASQMLRHVDITTIEGVYRFANDSVANNYKQLVADSLVSWLTEDLVKLSQNLLDETKIYFYPKATQGDIQVMTKSGLQSSMNAGQEFSVSLHVPGITFANPDLLDKITKSTIRIIDQSIKGTTIAISAIESTLRTNYGADVIDVKLTGMGGAANYDVVTLLDNANRLAIRKRLTAQPDGSLIVEDAVNFNYIDHDINNLS